MSEIGECAREEMGAPTINFTQAVAENVADLGFELGMKSCAEEEIVFIDCVAHALRSCKKTCRECRREGADDLVHEVNAMIIQREGREPPPLALGYGPSS